MITRLELKNFTTFREVGLDFSPKINVIIGENSTGKTHLLKAAYWLCGTATLLQEEPQPRTDTLETAMTTKLLRLFMPLEDKLGKLRNNGATGRSQLEARFSEGEKALVTFHANSRAVAIHSGVSCTNHEANPVFVPTKEVLSLARGLHDTEHDQRTVELIFDDTYVDLAKRLMRPAFDDPETRVDVEPRFGALIPKLVEVMGGRYRWEDGRFCFQEGSYKEKSAPGRSRAQHARAYQDSVTTRFIPARTPKYSGNMTAEGFRKLGILQLLLMNGSLNPGACSTLFWDEPESNLNPKPMKSLVEILLELSRNGQQVVLATHDYVLLKWLDLLMDKNKDDHVLFHSLYRDSSSGEVRAESADSYRQLNVNAIAATFSDLYDSEIDRSLGGQCK